jgi:hypothetical protein
VNRGFILSALTWKIQCTLSTITTVKWVEHVSIQGFDVPRSNQAGRMITAPDAPHSTTARTLI